MFEHLSMLKIFLKNLCSMLLYLIYELNTDTNADICVRLFPCALVCTGILASRFCTRFITENM